MRHQPVGAVPAAPRRGRGLRPAHVAHCGVGRLYWRRFGRGTRRKKYPLRASGIRRLARAPLDPTIQGRALLAGLVHAADRRYTSTEAAAAALRAGGMQRGSAGAAVSATDDRAARAGLRARPKFLGCGSTARRRLINRRPGLRGARVRRRRRAQVPDGVPRGSGLGPRVECLRRDGRRRAAFTGDGRARRPRGGGGGGDGALPAFDAPTSSSAISTRKRAAWASTATTRSRRRRSRGESRRVAVVRRRVCVRYRAVARRRADANDAALRRRAYFWWALAARLSWRRWRQGGDGARGAGHAWGRAAELDFSIALYFKLRHCARSKRRHAP